jgi:pimeloyl-ACP methyl ester carboxylesterase
MRMKQGPERGFLSFAFCSLVLSAVALLTVTGCGFGKLKKDVEELEIVGLISGTASAPGSTDGVHVLLFTETDEGTVIAGTNTLTQLNDSWAFILHTGVRYYVAGFRDLDGDRLYSAGEPVGLLGDDEPFVLKKQTRIFGISLELKADTVIPDRFILDARGGLLDDDAGLQMVTGNIIDFDDPRFTAEQAGDGMWSPLTALKSTGTGIYFLDEYDPGKIPVLFVHGLGGYPAEFRVLAEGMDLQRFQPWFMHYPSGFRLHPVGGMLNRLIASLQNKLGFETIYVVAHSMGGLIARASILQAARNPEVRDRVKLFVTIATPLQGHAAAEFGLKYTPEPVPAWIDMAPGSKFLSNIQKPLPEELPYYILFTFRRGSTSFMGGSHDTVVSVMSQIPLWAQEEAVRIRGYDQDHEGVLVAPQVVTELNRILDEVTPK